MILFLYMFIIFLVLFCLLFAFLTSRNLMWGLILVSALLPSYLIRFQVLSIPGTVLELMIWIVFAVWFIQHWQMWPKAANNFVKGKLPPAPLNQWFLVTILFFLAATIAIFVSNERVAALGLWKAYFVEPLLFFSVFISTVKKRTDINKIIFSLILGGLAVAIFAVIQKFTGLLIPNPFWQAVATRRVTSFFGYPNAVALYLTPLVPLVVYLFEKNKNHLHGFWLDLFYFVVFCFFVLAILFTKSFGAILALVVTLLIFGLINKKTRLAAFVCVVIIGAIIYFTPVRDPFSQEILFHGDSGALRVAMWGETIEMLKLYPLTGAGLGGYQLAVAPYHILKWAEIYLYPHNLFLNFWTETGLFGLIGFLWLVALFISEGVRQLKNKKHHAYLLTEALLASMLISLIHGFVDVPYFKNDLSVLFWILIGLMVVNSFVKD